MKIKNYLSLIITALVVVSCTDDVSDLEIVNQLSKKNNIRSYSEALGVAQNSISLLSTTTTRSGSGSREIDTTKTRAITRPVTRDGSVENDTIIYVFNFKDDNGFALVSASLATEELLAVTEKGNYFPNQPSEIEGFNEFVELAEQYVRVASSERRLHPDVEEPYNPELYRDSVVVTYAPVYQSFYEPPYRPFNWGQEFPEGEFCSNGCAGCVNVAIGEIMIFYSYPDSIQLTYPDADKNSQVLDWQNIQHNIIPGFPILQYTDTVTYYAVARLERQIGYLTNSRYYYNFQGIPVTGNDRDDIIPALEELNFSHGSWIPYMGHFVKSTMAMGQIFLVLGDLNSTEGHAWVLDHLIEKITTTYQLRWTERTGWVPTGEVNTTTSNLLHYNWGAYGSCNGYFNENVYTISEAEISDNTGWMTNGPSFNIDTRFLGNYSAPPLRHV